MVRFSDRGKKRGGVEARTEGREAGEGVLAWGERVAELRMDAEQGRVLESASKRVILNCCRQWGKSTTAAVGVAWRVVTKPGTVAVLAGPTLRQAEMLLEKVTGLLRRAGVAMKPAGGEVRGKRLDNGSMVVALPGNEETVRGWTASLVVVDEAARAPEEMYAALRPMLATTDGELWLLSTPAGKQGFFWREWTRGKEEWERVEARASGCARIPASFLEREKLALGERKFQQEYECSFQEVEGVVIKPEWLEAMERPDPEDGTWEVTPVR